MSSTQELLWWNKFSDIMGKHWRLTPNLNKAIRDEYVSDYHNFLFQKGGKLLEIGCGTGYSGHSFSKNGMYVDGLDFSEEQLAHARRMAKEEGIENIQFFHRDLVSGSLTGRFDQYDSILINAVLHHLHPHEIVTLLEKVSALLSNGGRLYIYEPLIPVMDDRLKVVMIKVIDFFLQAPLSFLSKIVVRLNLLDHEFKGAIKEGYTGCSPDEKPIDYGLVKTSCQNNRLNFREIIPFHNYSIMFSMEIMRLKSSYRENLSKFADLFYKLDRFLFKRFGWNNSISRTSRFIFCGMKFEKS